MVVVAIVALLGSFGVPAYQDYIRKTRVVESIALVAGLKVQIMDNVSNGRPFNEGLKMPTLTPWLSYITVDQGAGYISLGFAPSKFDGNPYYITLVPKDSGNGNLANLTGTATHSVFPAGNVVWSCRSAATTDLTPSTMPGKYVPESCKGRANY